MPDIRRFDSSRRRHWRSDDELKRIHQKQPWNRKRLRRSAIFFAFFGAAVLTQLGIWEYQRIEARHLKLSAVPANKQWRSCGEVREVGVAPLFRGDPGYNLFLDADGDGIACEPYIGNELRQLRWKLWQRN